MDLNGVLSIASSGLAAVEAQIAVASQNVSNASTSGYVAEQSNLSSRTAGGSGDGVIVGLTTRIVNESLENELYTQNATVSALQTTSNALSTISSLQGSTSSDSGSTGTLSDDVGNLQSSLITLEADPSSSASQEGVVTAATALTSTVQQTATAYQTQRQDAQDAIVSDVGQANSDLQLIGTLSTQIVTEQSQGISTADLENQRAAAMSDLSNLVSVKFTTTSDGDMTVTTASGQSLPTHVTTGPLSTADATVGVSDTYPGTIPAITIDGQDVTAQLTGGSIGANITLRDRTLPTMQAELDSFSQGLASRFDAQGLTLFSAADGTVPAADPTTASPAGELGFSQAITVNPAVSADPSLIRDGTHAVSGSATGASAFTVNTDRGDDDATLVDRLVSFSLGSQVQDGVDQPSISTNNLGASGTLQSPYSGSPDLADLAASLVSDQASTISANTTSLSDATAIQSSLSTKISSVSGVSVDDEMSAMVSLQNSYTANAKIVSAVQTMFQDLLSAID